MKITPDDVRAVKQLTHRKEFKDTVNRCRASETILGILRDAFHENVLSRMLRFLCDADETHGLGDLFVRQWLKSIPAGPFKLDHAHYQISAEFNHPVQIESEPDRYIDLILVLRKPSEEITAVLGVETKINSRESKKQIEDYQRYLFERFKGKTKRRYLFYLTPDGKNNKTSRRNTGCDCHDVSYKTVIDACQLLLKDSRVADANGGRTKTLLKDLSQFLEQDVVKNNSQSQIEKLITGLEEKGAAQALDILRDLRYRPTIRNFVYEDLLPRIRENFKNVEIEWHYSKGIPKRAQEYSTKPNEFNFKDLDIYSNLPKGAGFEIYYMLYSDKREPTFGDSVSILLMAFPPEGRIRFGPKLKAKFKSLQSHFPKSEGKCYKWGPWTCLWASDRYRLVEGKDKADPWGENTEKLAKLYEDAVTKTKRRLLRSLKNWEAV